MSLYGFMSLLVVNFFEVKTKLFYSGFKVIKSIHISWWILFYNTKTPSFYTFWPKKLPHQLMLKLCKVF